MAREKKQKEAPKDSVSAEQKSGSEGDITRIIERMNPDAVAASIEPAPNLEEMLGESVKLADPCKDSLYDYFYHKSTDLIIAKAKADSVLSLVTEGVVYAALRQDSKRI